jgi:REP-associated tyrosine transposase
MARHPRIVVPGIALHVCQRGNDRQDCFRHDNDRLVYLALLRDYARFRRCEIHAYCLMTNHVHLLVTPADLEGCTLMMRDLGRCYAAYFNRRYEKVGALWQHPFRSCLVDSAEYVMACYRYIERNPVRAHMVGQPDEYAWSSYSGNAALRRDELLTPHPEYLALGAGEMSRPRAYADLLNDPEPSDSLKALRAATDAGIPLVGARLKEELEKAGVRLERGTPGRRVRGDGAEDTTGELAFLTR